MTDESTAKRKRDLLIDLCWLITVPTALGLAVGIATFSRVNAGSSSEQTIAASEQDTGRTQIAEQTAGAEEVGGDMAERPAGSQNLRSACFKAVFAAILLTLFATVPGLLLPFFFAGASMPMATIAWRIPPTFGGIALANWWNEPERICFVNVLLACYFTALVLESGLLIRRLSVSSTSVPDQGRD